jgi:hypothetical protein
VSPDQLVCRIVILPEVVKIAVSIPEDVFAAAEAEAHRRGINRSALYTEALRQLTMTRSAIDEAIVAGYQRDPQDVDIDVDALVSMTDDLGDYR